MLTVIRLRVAALAAVAGALLLPAVAAAHPLGNFTINHASGLRVAATGVVVDHVIDMAEIPTFSAFREVDTDGDGIASDPERAAAARSRCADQAGALVLSVGGASIPLSVTGSAISFPMGQGAPTLRLVCRLEAAVAGRCGGRGGVLRPDLRRARRLARDHRGRRRHDGPGRCHRAEPQRTTDQLPDRAAGPGPDRVGGDVLRPGGWAGAAAARPAGDRRGRRRW